jgi:hypothetical protein
MLGGDGSLRRNLDDCRVFLLLGAIAIAAGAIVDALRGRQQAFSLAGSSKGLWRTLLVVPAVLAFSVSTDSGGDQPGENQTSGRNDGELRSNSLSDVGLLEHRGVALLPAN